MTDIQQIRDECEKNLILFGRTISPKTFYCPTPKFHYDMCDLLMDRSKIQVCIEAPRGFAKSTLAILLSLHHIVYDEGDKVVIIQSKTRPEAINRLNKIKNILNYSRAFNELYGYAGEESENTEIWREDKIKSNISGRSFSIRAIGTGQPARGTLESGIERYADGTVDLGDDTRITLYYLDDPEDEDNTKTIDAMQYNWDKFVGAKEGLDPRTGRVIVVGTPIHEKCIVERIKELDESGWYCKWYEAHDDNFNNLLWSEFRSGQWLKDKYTEFDKDGNLRKYYSEYRCSLIPSETQKFKPKDNRYYEGTLIAHNEKNFLVVTKIGEIEYEPPLKIPVNVFTGIDPASSEEKTADYSVIFNVAYDADKRIFCLPYYRERADPYDFVLKCDANYEKIKATRTHIETTGYQKALKSFWKGIRKDKESSIPGIEKKFNPRIKKLGDGGRLESLVPMFRDHRVFLLDGMEEFKNELLFYPRPKFDDLLDGFWYATERLIQPYHLWEDEPEFTEDELMYINRKGRLRKTPKLVNGYLAC